jgi:hypothetical protein
MKMEQGFLFVEKLETKSQTSETKSQTSSLKFVRKVETTSLAFSLK